MSTEQAIIAMQWAGKRVTRYNWLPSDYLFMDSEGNIRDDGGNIHKIYQYHNKDWEIKD